MAQNYECMLLMTPELAEEAVQAHLDQFSKLITEHGGELLHTQLWGRRRLEYAIFGQVEAIFAIFHFRMESAGSLVEEFERRVRINDDLLREMTVKVPELKIVEQAPGLWRDLRYEPRPGRGGYGGFGGGNRGGGGRRPDRFSAPREGGEAEGGVASVDNDGDDDSDE